MGHRMAHMPGPYAYWMDRWERKLATRDTNRVVRPFEWGTEWLTCLDPMPTGWIAGSESSPRGTPTGWFVRLNGAPNGSHAWTLCLLDGSLGAKARHAGHQPGGSSV